jgi:hypothetical protein
MDHEVVSIGGVPHTSLNGISQNTPTTQVRDINREAQTSLFDLVVEALECHSRFHQSKSSRLVDLENLIHSPPKVNHNRTSDTGCCAAISKVPPNADWPQGNVVPICSLHDLLNFFRAAGANYRRSNEGILVEDVEGVVGHGWSMVGLVLEFFDSDELDIFSTDNALKVIEGGGEGMGIKVLRKDTAIKIERIGLGRSRAVSHISSL